jgi:hypothetical protein
MKANASAMNSVKAIYYRCGKRNSRPAKPRRIPFRRYDRVRELDHHDKIYRKI